MCESRLVLRICVAEPLNVGGMLRSNIKLKASKDYFTLLTEEGVEAVLEGLANVIRSPIKIADHSVIAIYEVRIIKGSIFKFSMRGSCTALDNSDVNINSKNVDIIVAEVRRLIYNFSTRRSLIRTCFG